MYSYDRYVNIDMDTHYYMNINLVTFKAMKLFLLNIYMWNSLYTYVYARA